MIKLRQKHTFSRIREIIRCLCPPVTKKKMKKRLPYLRRMFKFALDVVALCNVYNANIFYQQNLREMAEQGVGRIRRRKGPSGRNKSWHTDVLINYKAVSHLFSHFP